FSCPFRPHPPTSTLFPYTTLFRSGKAMQAVSFNHTAAALMGISVDRIITFTFMIGSMLAAAAGVLVALKDPKIEPYMGLLPGLKAFVAAVLGGIGNVPGAVVGGLVMGIAEVMVVGYVSPTYRDAIAFVLLILILLVRPAGLLGRQTAEKVGCGGWRGRWGCWPRSERPSCCCRVSPIRTWST